MHNERIGVIALVPKRGSVAIVVIALVEGQRRGQARPRLSTIGGFPNFPPGREYFSRSSESPFAARMT